MKIRETLAVLGVAAATTAFTLVLFGPGRVGATDETGGIKPRILQPKLTADGCVFTLKTDKPTYEAGETLTLQIEATNPTDKPVETTVWVNISTSSPFSLGSRSLTIPQQFWSSGKCSVKLNPGETKTVTLPTETKLPAGQMVSIGLSSVDRSIVARSLGVQSGTQNTLSVPQAAPVIQLVPEK